MTVTRGSTLLFSFRSKIEEAVSFVPRMCAEEKLKAVQFWNYVSEKLQEIINNSAADINAVALKLDEENAEKITLESSNAINVVPQSISSTDLINLPENYSNCSETNLQYRTDEVCDNQLKQIISSTTGVNDCSVPSDQDSVVSLSNITYDNSTKQFPQEVPKNFNVLSNEFTVVQNIPISHSNSYTINIYSSEISDNLSHSQNNAFSSSTEPFVNNCDKTQQIQLDHRTNNFVTTDKNCGEIIVTNVHSLRDLKKRKNSKRKGTKVASSKSSFLKTEATSSNSDKKAESEKILKVFPSVGENSQESFQDIDPVNSETSNESNSAENIVSFIVSNSEEILAKNDIMLEKENGTVESKFSCKDCDQQFSDSESLASHHCNPSKPYPCTECDALFSTKGNLIVHFRKHTGEKPYTCNKCSASFSTKGNLKRHIKTHSGEKPWQCSKCGGRFTEKKTLTVHMRRHTGERPYQCKMCGKKFAQSGILQTHMAMHLDQRFHLCEHCGKSFRQKSQLRIHKLRHDNIRRYPCGCCAASFLTKGDLDRHMRTHTGERPYTCDICSKCFTRQQSLNEHTNRHYGLKPYGCKYCGKGFAEMSACYKHVKQHENGNEENALENQTNKTVKSSKPKPEAKNESPATENCEDNEQSTYKESSKLITILVDSEASETQSERNITTPFIHTFLH